ncbi:MAG: DUF488 domain-containing protein [Candidatus Margulisiibacteriota bacterium]
MRKQIHTIGHSNIDSDQLINRLKQYNISAIVDIRSKPYSKYSPHFNRETFEHTCKSNNIIYFYLGDYLGGKPNDPSVINDSNEIDYYLLSQKDYFLMGINKLLNLINKQNTCLMCSEGQPNKCHRNLLVAPILKEKGIEVLHILPSGETIASEELLPLKGKKQLALF